MPDEVPTRRGVPPQASKSSRLPDEEVIRKVTDKVYALLMQDLTIDYERHHPSARFMGGNSGYLDQGGW